MRVMALPCGACGAWNSSLPYPRMPHGSSSVAGDTPKRQRTLNRRRGHSVSNFTAGSVAGSSVSAACRNTKRTRIFRWSFHCRCHTRKPAADRGNPKERPHPCGSAATGRVQPWYPTARAVKNTRQQERAKSLSVGKLCRAGRPGSSDQPCAESQGNWRCEVARLKTIPREKLEPGGFASGSPKE